MKKKSELNTDLATTEEIIDFAYYWRMLLKRKWLIIFSAFVCTLMVVFFVYNLKSVYKASTTVLIDTDSSNLISLSKVPFRGTQSDKKDYLETQFKILESREISATLVKRLELDTHALFDPRQKDNNNFFKPLLNVLSPDYDPDKNVSEEEILNQVVDSFMENLSVLPIKNTNLVTINFESYDPKLAALITDTMADVYIEDNLQAKLNSTKKAADWLNGQLEDLRVNLKKSEKALQTYREEANLLDVQGVKTIDTGELSLLTSRYIEAKNRRYEAETVYRQLKSLGSNPSLQALLGIPSVLKDPLVQRFKSAQVQSEQKVAELKSLLGPRHPDMISATSELRSSENALKQQVSRVVEGIEADYRQFFDKENTLNSQIEQSKKRFQDINRKEFKLRELEREVETNRQIYDLFLNRSKETDQASGLHSAHARIVDRAVPPRIPTSPKRKQIVIIAFILSLLMASAFVFLINSLDSTIHTTEDLEEKLNIDVLAKVPLDKNNRSKTVYEGFLSQSNSTFTESIRSMRTSFVFLSLDDPYKVTMIASSVPNEGKSTIALNLSESIAQMEKTLLIDGDFRRPSLYKAFKMPSDTPGFSDFIAGKKKLDDCVHNVHEGLDFLPAGSMTSNPLEILDSKNTEKMFQHFRSHYDRIIIDTAPINAVSDGIVLSKYTDCVIYVVRAEETLFPLVAKGIKNLKKVDANIGGLILNGVDPKDEIYYQGYNTNIDYS